ncbi:MAG: L-lactate permease [SAR202 cluster bacterium]|nr:L-lactate permease [SAR202 cluster bacterium]
MARWSALAWMAFSIPHAVLAAALGPELPTMGGALVGGAAFTAILAFAQGRRARSARGGGRLLVAAAPYLALIGLILVTRLAPPLRDALRSVEVRWAFAGEFGGTVEPLYHPGTMLFIAFLAGALAQRTGGRAAAGAMLLAGKRIVAVAVTLLVMLTLARTLVVAGMTETMAVASASAAQSAWPLLVPALGALSSFITGSATASNVLFSEFQTGVARELGNSPTQALSGQTVGAAIGNTVSPQNIVAGSATVGTVGQEGAVLRRTAPVFVAALVLAGMLAFALQR